MAKNRQDRDETGSPVADGGLQLATSVRSGAREQESGKSHDGMRRAALNAVALPCHALHPVSPTRDTPLPL